MPTIQQSIEIRVPVHTAYDQLTRFEDYPYFMEEVQAVQQLDDTRLHWTTVMSNRPVEWEAEITEQEPDRCIAWHNTSGPINAGKIEVQPAGTDASRITFTLQAELQQVPGAGNSEQEMAQRLRLDLARLKDFIEAHGSQGSAGEDADHAARPLQGRAQPEQKNRGSDSSAPVVTSGYAAGSEGWSGDEDPTSPVASSSQGAMEQKSDATGPDRPQTNQSTQSDNALSKSADDDSAEDGRFSVAEEVSFDQQSDAVRHIGQMPPDTGTDQYGAESASDAMGEAMHQDAEERKKDAKLKPSMDRSVPPSE